MFASCRRSCTARCPFNRWSIVSIISGEARKACHQISIDDVRVPRHVKSTNHRVSKARHHRDERNKRTSTVPPIVARPHVVRATRIGARLARIDVGRRTDRGSITRRGVRGSADTGHRILSGAIQQHVGHFYWHMSAPEDIVVRLFCIKGTDSSCDCSRRSFSRYSA